MSFSWFSSFVRPATFILSFSVLAPYAQASLITLNTLAKTCARIAFSDRPEVHHCNEIHNGVSHTHAFDGNPMTPSQARTAGRAGPGAVAANGSIVHRDGFPFRNYTFVGGAGGFVETVQTLAGGPHEVLLDFFLPAGFLEYTTNMELGDAFTFAAHLEANLSVCEGVADCNHLPSDLVTTLFSLRTDLQVHP
jgi:hypothetical protein